MIVDRGKGRKVVVRYRDPETRERQVETISNHYPYFFVEKKEMPVGDPGWDLARSEGVIGVDDNGDVGVYGEELLKVTCSYPEVVSKIRNGFHQTWEANIPWTVRVLADTDIEIPMYEHRVWTLDAEWLVDSGRINMITVHDSYTDKLYTWFLDSENEKDMMVSSMECTKHPDGIETLKFETDAMQCRDEKTLLTAFAKHMDKHDPDVLMGWYLVGADIKQIAGRMRANRLNPAIMSPLRKHRYDYGDWDQPIPGRICFDLMLGFVKLWTVKNGQLPGRKLDDVAWEVLKERKVPLEDGHDTYYTDLATYIDYNRQDVRLLPRLNDMLNCLNHYLTLMHLCKVDFRATPHVTKLTTGLLLNDEEWKYRIPTRPQHEYEPYDGADIMEPKAGVYRNVGILDIRAMYHSNVDLHNISWDTLDESGKDCGNGVQFSQGKQGTLGRLMGNLTNLRNEYKAKKAQATDPAEITKYDAMQYATKSLVASLYGVCGDSKYSLYHPKVAASITFTSRETLGRLRSLSEERGSRVIYGHTDSVFVEAESVDILRATCDDINEVMHPIVVEFEKYAESMFIKAKNRYAGKVVWSEGKHLEEPDYYVKGIELKQSRLPPAMKTTMLTVLRGILDGRTQDEVSESLSTLIDDVVNERVPLEDLMIRGSLSRPLGDYASISGASQGALWANTHLNKSYGEGDYFHCILTDTGEYVAFDEPEEIDGIVEVGFTEMATRFIVKKARDLYDVVGWDYTPLESALRGTSGVTWL